MKKLIILLLAFVSMGMFAQDSQRLYALKDDNIHNEYAAIGNTVLGDHKVDFASSKNRLDFSQNKNNRKTFLDPTTKELPIKEDWLMINKKLFEENDFKFHEGLASFTKDRKTVFFSVNRKIKKKQKNKEEVKTKSSVNLQLFKAHVNENGAWVNLEMLPFNSKHFSTGQPALNLDDTKLYFVSDRPESMGRTDIFVVDLHKDGTYGKPKNLGPKINSREREIFPFIGKKNVLYFSSDVYNGKGNLDVFASKIYDNTMSRRIKLGARVNNGKDNFIYDLATYPSIDFKCQQKVSGIVKNVDTYELLPDVQIILFDNNGKKLKSFLSGKTDASFSFKQSCNTFFKLKGYLEGYSIGVLDTKTINDLNADPKEIVLNMTKVNTKNSSSSTEISIRGEHYNFSSDKPVYTIQIGALKQNIQTKKYIHLTSLFNHRYEDGFNRYYSGIFESYEAALNYMKLLKKDGYDDAFVVGLKGEKIF